jgi:NNP family nitrate/nitrite transporter-like MFS transporter
MTDLKKDEISWKPSGNPKVLWVSFTAFTLGFGIWAMFSALGPFLIKWYDYTPTQTLFLSSMPPLFAACISIPLGVWADRYGGRKVFTITLIILLFTLIMVPFADNYFLFLVCGMLLGLGGASFIIGNAHVSIWYPQSQQGTALGIFALGNIGIILGMVIVPFLITNLLGGPLDYADMPAKLVFGPLAGWRFIFIIFAIPTFVMAIVYWTMTSEPPVRIKKKLTNREILDIFKSSPLVWVIAFLYWASFGTLTFFSAFSPTYLAVRWNVDPAQASMVYAASFVACVAIMRPIGGWLSDRHNPITMLKYLFGGGAIIAVVLIFEISFTIQVTSMMCASLLAGAAAATVVKLIPTYFPKAVGTVSGLAKAAGAACGFTSTSIMALSSYFTGSYKTGFFMWIVVSVAALSFVLFPRVFQQREKEATAREED